MIQLAALFAATICPPDHTTSDEAEYVLML
jgi:hypothetical protein